jgi:hypothetical protein
MLFDKLKNTLSRLNRFGLFCIRPGYSKIYLGDILDSIYLFVKIRFGNELILEIKYGGLGDHLFYSALPEKLISLGKFKKIYISTKSQYRFPGIKELVWGGVGDGGNPYISGFIDKKGWTHSGIRPEAGNFTDGINHFFKTQDYEVSGSSPKIYYRPKFINYYRNKILVDLNVFSNGDLPDPIKIKNYLIKHKIPDLLFVKGRISKSLLKLMDQKNLQFVNLPRKLEDYCDLVWSCRKFICLYSGGNSLAPALNKKAFVLCKFYDPAQSYKLNKYIILN